MIHVATLMDTGVGVPFAAHDNKIISAAYLPITDEIVTIDETGTVRNWQNFELQSQWKVPGLVGAASISIRPKSLMVLKWEKHPESAISESFGTLGWDSLAAAFEAEVYERQTGELLKSNRRVAIRDSKSDKLKTARALTEKELAQLPILSKDGGLIAWTVNDSEGHYRLMCKDLFNNATVVEEALDEPLRIDFDDDGEQILAVRSNLKNDNYELNISEIPLRSKKQSRSVMLVPSRKLADTLKSMRTFTTAFPFAQEPDWLDAFATFTTYYEHLDELPEATFSFFNRSGRIDLATLIPIPLVVRLNDDEYIDFRHRTNDIRLHSKNGKVLREFPMIERNTFVCPVDSGRSFLTCGLDMTVRLVSIADGSPAGEFRLPFEQINGMYLSAGGRVLLFWGDSGKILLFNTDFAHE
jgi:hypothetical protein